MDSATAAATLEAAPPALQVVVWTLLPLTFVFSLACVALVYKRHAEFPLNGRDVTLVIAFAIYFSNAAYLNILTVVVVPTPCALRFLKHLAESALLSLVCARIFRLWLKLSLSQYQLDQHRAQKATLEQQKSANHVQSEGGNGTGNHVHANVTLTIASDAGGAEAGAGAEAENSVERVPALNSLTEFRYLSSLDDSDAEGASNMNTTRTVRHVSTLPEGRTTLTRRDSGFGVIDPTGAANGGMQELMYIPLDFESYEMMQWKIYLAQTKTIWTIHIVFTAALALTMGLLLAFVDTCADVEDGWIETFLQIHAGIVVIVVFVMTWKIRHMRDGYFIGYELLCLAKLVFLFAASVTASQVVTDSLAKHIVSVAYWFLLNYVTVISCVFPVAKSYGYHISPVNPVTWFTARKTNGDSEDDDDNNGIKLQDVLLLEEHKESREEFEQFLATEFAIENIAFWDRARDFKEQSAALSDDELAVCAAGIFYDFIADEAPQQLNISARTRETITKDLHSAITNLAKFSPNEQFKGTANPKGGGRERSPSTNKPPPSPRPQPHSVNASGEGALANANANAIDEDELKAPFSMAASTPRSRRLSADRRVAPPSGGGNDSRRGSRKLPPKRELRRQRSARAPRSSLVAAMVGKGVVPAAKAAAPPPVAEVEIHVELSDCVSPEVFEGARKEVYRLMQRDSYKRFRAFKRHQAALASHKEQSKRTRSRSSRRSRTTTVEIVNVR